MRESWGTVNLAMAAVVGWLPWQTWDVAGASPQGQQLTP